MLVVVAAAVGRTFFCSVFFQKNVSGLVIGRRASSARENVSRDARAGGGWFPVMKR
jgi:hypothetical protein